MANLRTPKTLECPKASSGRNTRHFHLGERLVGPIAIRMDQYWQTRIIPAAVLPQWQIPDLAFPFTGIAAFRDQDNVLDGGPHCDLSAHFEDARHSHAFHDTAVGMRRNR